MISVLPSRRNLILYDGVIPSTQSNKDLMYIKYCLGKYRSLPSTLLNRLFWEGGDHTFASESLYHPKSDAVTENADLFLYFMFC